MSTHLVYLGVILRTLQLQGCAFVRAAGFSGSCPAYERSEAGQGQTTGLLALQLILFAVCCSEILGSVADECP